MNGVSFFKMIQSQSSPQASVSPSGKATNDKASFFQLLKGSINGNTSEISSSVEESESRELMVNELISELVAIHSEGDTLLTKDMLTSPMVEELVEQLPMEFQLELQALFEGIVSIEKLIEQGEEGNLANPIQLLAVMIGLVHSQSQSQANNEITRKGPDQSAEKILSELEKLVAMLTKSEQIVEKKAGKDTHFVLHDFTKDTAEKSVKGNPGIALPSAQGPLNPVMQFVIHVGENRGDQAINQQFLRQFQNILGRSTLAQFPNGVNQLTIKLFPEHLGRVDVKLTQQNGIIVAELMTTTKAAKSAIESQLHQLRIAFSAQNIQVDKIEISTQQQQHSLGQSDKENQDGKNHNKSNQEQQSDQDNVKEAVNFEDVLEKSFNVKV